MLRTIKIVLQILTLNLFGQDLKAQDLNHRYFQALNNSKANIWSNYNNGNGLGEYFLDFSTEPPLVSQVSVNSTEIHKNKLYHPLNSTTIKDNLIYLSRFTIFNNSSVNHTKSSGNPRDKEGSLYKWSRAAEYRESAISPPWDTTHVYFFSSPDSNLFSNAIFSHHQCYKTSLTYLLDSSVYKMSSENLVWFTTSLKRQLVSSPVVIAAKDCYWIVSTVFCNSPGITKWEIASVKWTKNGFEPPIFTSYDKFESVNFFPLIPQQQWANKQKIIFDDGGISDSIYRVAQCKKGLTHYLLIGTLDTISGKIINQSYINTLRDSAYKNLKYTDGDGVNYKREIRSTLTRNYSLKAATAFSPNGEIFYFSDRLGGPGIGFFQLRINEFNQVDSLFYQIIYKDLKWSGYNELIEDNVKNSWLSQVETHNLTTVYFSTAPNRKLYLGHYDKIDNEELYLSQIDFPDKMGPAMGFSKRSILLQKGGGLFVKYNNFWNSFQKCDPSLSPATPWTPYSTKYAYFTVKNVTCGKTTLRNLSHNNFVSYQWILPWSDTLITTQADTNITLSSPQTGQFLVKVKAIDRNGKFQWYSSTVTFKANPIAKFKTQQSIHCQWVNIDYTDSSYFPFTGLKNNWKWYFGDSSAPFEIQKPNGVSAQNISARHSYTRPGKYITTLVVSDGYCTDTVSAEDSVAILPAPRPGITIDKTTGCSPLNVEFGRLYTDPTDSTIYHFKPSLVPNNRFDQAINKVLIQQSGRFTLFQKLYGPSGCITQDSAKLTITPGITAGHKPQLKRSTVINNSTTLTEWKPVPYAKSYQVYRNGQLHAVVNDTFFKDYLSTEIDQSHTYEIQAKDSCDNLGGLKSNIGKTIFLKVTEVEPASKSDFPTALLTWSPYEDWATNGGVKRHESFGTYDIETSNWQPLNNQKDTQFSDKDFVQPKKFQKCYIVKAQSSDLAYESQSNSYCLGYQATLFAPSAFTPNGDGLNDEFEIFNYGFDHFTLTIFNSWGQKIYEQEGSTAIWKPAVDMPQGVYVYTVKASRENKEYTFSSTVTLLK